MGSCWQVELIKGPGLKFIYRRIDGENLQRAAPHSIILLKNFQT